MPLPNNESDQGSPGPKGAKAPPQPTGVEIELDEEFMHHGKIYGPGKLTVEDDGGLKATDIARDLQRSQDRVRNSRRPGQAVLRPNRTITGIQPGTELDDHISNALSPEDVSKLREDANKEAEERAAEDAARKPPARRATPVSTSGAPSPKGASAATTPKGTPTSPPPPPPAA